MKALLIGYSSIARRRVLPALAAAGIAKIDVASRSAAGNIELPAGVNGRIFQDYKSALRESEAEIVYISAVNSLHAELAAAALESERHVLIDKPAATQLRDARSLIEMARKTDRLLAEAIVYGYHPQIGIARRAFEEAESRPTQIIAAFSFPPLPDGNFRRNAALGGGALFDLGPYAVSLGRLFFAEKPQEILGRADRKADSIDESFSMLAVFSGSRSVTGHFGMTTGYVNQFEVLGPGVRVSVERAFTTTPDMECKVRVSSQNRSGNVCIPPADPFYLFLCSALEAIRTGDTGRFSNDILADAEALDLLRRSCFDN